MNPTNPPAFPLPPVEARDGQLLAEYESGMSLLDFFAAKALVLIDNNLTRREINMSFEAVAKTAYDIAAAMLAERERRIKEGR